MVAKQTAVLNGLGHLIGSPSPRYSRKLERELHFILRTVLPILLLFINWFDCVCINNIILYLSILYSGIAERLERRKPPLDQRQHHSRNPEHFHTPHPADMRVPPHNNPQFAKWIMEQNPQLYSDMGQHTGSDIDLQSMSSLANIPERDHPVNTELSYIESASRGGNYEYSEKFRSDSPPVRDSSPSKELHSSSFPNFGSSVVLPTRPSPVTSGKFSPMMRVESDAQVSGSLKGKPRIRDEFSSISSQLTMESQPMLTPFSQGQTSSQQQHQHLDKLSMDVMQHTQLSGSSFQGITSLIPRINNKGKTTTPGDLSHLGRKGLKEFEMDDIALEKQRLQLMFYEQQKQKEQSELKEMSSKEVAPLSDDQNDDDDIEDGNLSQEQLRQELESLEEMVVAQRKKYREVKFSREREELKLKEIEHKFREQDMNVGTFVLSSGDHKRWLLRELEKLKNDQNMTIQQFQYSERRAKTKLKAYETQASELRQQLCISTPSAPSPSLASRAAHDTYDVVPSKLTSEHSKKSSSKNGQEPPSSTASELNWSDLPSSKTFSSAPARAKSIEDMSAAVFEPPDLAREPMNTISASCLTEPTQDEPRHSHWPPYKSNHRSGSAAYSTESHGQNSNFNAESVDLEGSQSIPPPSMPDSRNDRIPIRRGPSLNPSMGTREDRSSPTKGSIYAIPEFNEMLQATYDVPTTRPAIPQQTTFLHAQPTGTQPGGRHWVP